MENKQKRKVSKSRIYQLYKRDIDTIGGLIYPDEKFLPVKGESAIWVSNYARLLSKRKGKPKILKTVFQKGCHRTSGCALPAAGSANRGSGCAGAHPRMGSSRFRRMDSSSAVWADPDIGRSCSLSVRL